MEERKEETTSEFVKRKISEVAENDMRDALDKLPVFKINWGDDEDGK